MSEVLTDNRNAETRSAGVTAAATLGMLGSISALFAWGWFFVSMLGLPRDDHGKHVYEAHPLFFFAIALVPPLLIGMGLRIGIGIFQLKPWARRGALLWASLALVFSSAVIAFRPYETFVISESFVSSEASFRQLLAVSFVIFTFPFGAWWLILFTRRHVIAQFEEGARVKAVKVEHT
jgi:hypothetical protein